MKIRFDKESEEIINNLETFNLTIDQIKSINNVRKIIKEFMNISVNDLMFEKETISLSHVKYLLKNYNGLMYYFKDDEISLQFIEHLKILVYITHKNKIKISPFNINNLKITSDKTILSQNTIM